MILLLIAAGTFTAVLGDVPDTVIIATVVMVNTATGVTQEVRAERAIAALGALAAPTARVIRDDVLVELPARELVPGDLLSLSAGDVVPADARVVATHDLEVDQAAMTGESLPVEISPGDELWGGTLVTAGRASATVTRTGAASAIGRLASLMAATRIQATPLQRRLTQLSRILVTVVVVLTAVVVAQGLTAGRPVPEMALVGVSLAVAAVPESLPAVVAVALALGAHRMARRNAVVRRLLAVETLGSVTVIATDKTGTLTEGRMVAERLWTPRATPEDEARLLRDLVLCNDAVITHDGVTTGEPLEAALLVFARSRGLDIHRTRTYWARVSEEPFDHRLRRMRTRHRAPDRTGLGVEKGAPESVLTDLPDYEEGLVVADDLARDGYRVIAVAEQQEDQDGGTGPWELVGLVGIVDPPREEAADVVGACHRAGIRVMLVTGDHPGTARAIAARVGIRDEPGSPGIHARVRPEDKVAIVDDLRDRGEVVAMLGDGVNDAPALRRADIGVAAGRGGTEVARQAADLVLLDDDFRSVVAAVEEGRRIYTNIRTFLLFAVSGGLAEVGVMVIGPLIGLAQPLLPAQILWINLMTHGPTGVAFGMDPVDPLEMASPPRRPGEGVFTKTLTARLAIACALLVATSLVAGKLVAGDLGRTVTFLSLGLGQLAVASAIRARPGRTGGRNPALMATLAGAAALMVLATIAGPLQTLLHTEPVPGATLLAVVALAAVPGLVLAALVRREHARRLRPETS